MHCKLRQKRGARRCSQRSHCCSQCCSKPAGKLYRRESLQASVFSSKFAALSSDGFKALSLYRPGFIEAFKLQCQKLPRWHETRLRVTTAYSKRAVISRGRVDGLQVGGSNEMALRSCARFSTLGRYLSTVSARNIPCGGRPLAVFDRDLSSITMPTAQAQLHTTPSKLSSMAPIPKPTRV